MEEDPGRPKRVIKVKNLNAFSYDEEDLQFLKYNRELSHQPRSEENLEIDAAVSVDNTEVPKGWSELDFLLNSSYLTSTGCIW